MTDDDYPLYGDIHAMSKFSKSLVPTGRPSSHATPPVAAVERGERSYPDGKRESYERVEFKD